MTTKITIQQIAELAGVNKATVSRVINGSATISDKTKEKIEKIIKEYNYVPNTLARGLASNKTFTIGFCHDYTDKRAFANLFFYKVLQGIENVVYRNDYMFLMMSHHAREHGKSMFERVVSERKVDGLLIPSALLTEENHQLLIKHQIPFVVLGEEDFSKPDIRWVDVDNQQAANVLTSHLAELGYRRIAIYYDKAAAARDRFIQHRIKGYSGTLSGLNLPHIVETDPEALYACSPDAIICCTHEQLFGLLDENKDVSAPRAASGIALATFDDSPLFQYLRRPIHYVSIDLERMGEEAAALLFSVIHQAADIPDHLLIPTSSSNITQYD